MPRGKKRDQADKQPDEKKAGAELDKAHEAEVLHNLSGTVLSGFARLYEIEAKTSQHIAPLREQRKDAWSALRTDSRMQREELAPYFAIYSRARSLDDFEDQEAAAVLKDNLRRLYQSLAQGDQMSFLDAVETVKPGANSETPVSARREGYRDFGLGMRFDQCPYDDAVNREAWQTGWHAARDTFNKDAPPAGPKEPPAEAATQH